MSKAKLTQLVSSLVEAGASGNVILRSLALETGTSVGLQIHDASGLAFGPGGEILSPVPPGHASTHRVPDRGLAWVAEPNRRSGDHEYLLMQLSMGLMVTMRVGADLPVALVPPIQVLIDDGYAESVRAVYLRSVGVRPAEVVRVVAAVGEQRAWNEFTTWLSCGDDLVVSSTVNSQRHVALLRCPSRAQIEVLSMPGGLRAAQSPPLPAIQAPAAYTVALHALRFAVALESEGQVVSKLQTPFSTADNLGGFEILCHLTRDQINSVGDVQALDSLIEEYGVAVLRVLEAYSSTESLRQAAALVYMHHNTLTYWIERSETRLGFELKGPYRRTRLLLALCLHRLRGSLDT